MDRELRDRWVAALRSGKYEQGKRRLKNGNKFCCLGVLCSIADIPISDDGKEVMPSGGYGKLHDVVGSNVFVFDLWDKNDRGDTFAEIADWIEANL